jgi:hypothetical protein
MEVWHNSYGMFIEPNHVFVHSCDCAIFGESGHNITCVHFFGDFALRWYKAGTSITEDFRNFSYVLMVPIWHLPLFSPSTYLLVFWKGVLALALSCTSREEIISISKSFGIMQPLLWSKELFSGPVM